METTGTENSKKQVGGIEMDNLRRKEPERKVHYKRVKSEAEIKRRLQKHFSNPYTLCINAGIKGCPQSMPKKLVIMLLKWIFVSAQLLKFGYNRMEFAQFLDRNNIALKNLVLKNWITQYETMPYPHATGIHAVYSKKDLIQYVQYTIDKARQLPDIAVGSFFVSSRENLSYIPVEMCVLSYKYGKYDNQNREVNMDSSTTEECFTIGADNTSKDIVEEKLLPLMRSDDNLVRLLKVKINFNIDSIHVKRDTSASVTTKCFTIYSRVIFDNKEMNGQIPITMKTSIDEFTCTGETAAKRVEYSDIALFIVVGSTSILSMVVCGISLQKSLCLCFIIIFGSSRISGDDFPHTRNFFLVTQPEPLSRQGTWEIVKFRDIIMIFSDVLNLTGCVIKFRLDTQTLSSTSILYDTCGISLGFGSFLVWLGIMRFLAYDKGFNLLFSVMERSFLPILRFLACALLFFIAFSLSGWVVLSPYHIKFSSLIKTIRCFFALSYGDEIYVTMNTVTDVSLSVIIYNDMIIGIYLVLFALVAINIIIAIFNSTYENIRTRNHEFLQSDLMEFIGHKPLL